MSDIDVGQLLDTIRKQLEDGDAMGCTYKGERFISQETVQRVFASKEIDKFITNRRYQDTAEQSQLESSSDASLMLFAVALVARLDHYYLPLLLSGITDDILFDDDAFRACCQFANVPDADFDCLRSNRNRFGATICPGKRHNISRGVVLPHLARKKMANGSCGVVYRVEFAPGHLRGSNEVRSMSSLWAPITNPHRESLLRRRYARTAMGWEAKKNGTALSGRQSPLKSGNIPISSHYWPLTSSRPQNPKPMLRRCT